jgi:hypothetical protein
MSGPHDTTPAPPATVDAEFVTLAADDLADLAEILEGSAMTLRGLIASMRQAAEAPVTKGGGA